jgi:hypothetical protein
MFKFCNYLQIFKILLYQLYISIINQHRQNTKICLCIYKYITFTTDSSEYTYILCLWCIFGKIIMCTFVQDVKQFPSLWSPLHNTYITIFRMRFLIFYHFLLHFFLSFWKRFLIYDIFIFVLCICSDWTKTHLRAGLSYQIHT